MSKDDLAL
ncbi:bb388fac-ece9-448f-91e1-9c58400d46ac [Thermothielavioides terrestris]|uniref:Bb388fac-ece9-448f-91e1-9c58400d46ac n=1 Tax=Thermothielavioides terrestris TaxID=2587410 RepID=A0A446BND7_9PEZI|nr:bb388fac-ece9-448f-91e1-9c58400d46ac [Thermothielavioides terrestris]